VLNTNAWYTFLNYYFWMQQNVDLQVGRVITALKGSSFAANTIVVFLSDHGDYAGSHWLHGKGFGLYDEPSTCPFTSSSRQERDGTPIQDLQAEKNPAAVALGKLGGPKGGRARAENLSPKRRSAIAKRAALARWRRDGA
jgi:arylsulfatase A-like enzyme